MCRDVVNLFIITYDHVISVVFVGVIEVMNENFQFAFVLAIDVPFRFP